jgi:hypothetical protein
VWVDKPGEADRLYIQAHQPFYHRGGVENGPPNGYDPEGAASIRVNGGEWVDVRDKTVDCKFPESEYWCVAGGYSTIRFTLDLDSVEKGLNTVEFRYNGTKGIRSGYRVIDLDIRNDSGESLIQKTRFQYPDYEEWSPPIEKKAAIKKGKKLFQKRDSLLNNPLEKKSITASCADCHSDTGRDLKYFNYSNRVIEARARFHGLSRKQSEQIASYIRSIELTDKDGKPYTAPGTPWDPPYQPGPELLATGKPAAKSKEVYWAAGAGLEWVLDRDRQMLKHMFPKDGDYKNGVAWETDGDGRKKLPYTEEVSPEGELSSTKIPVAVQFPDWNNWLPDVHPIDVAPEEYKANPGVEMLYDSDGRLREAIEDYNHNFDRKKLRELDVAMKRFNMGLRGIGNYGHELDSLASHLPKEATGYEKSMANTSGHRWFAVQVWDLMTRLNLQGATDETYGSEPRDGLNPERGWIGRQRWVFNLAPHIAAPTGQNDAPWVYGSERLEKFMSHAWYQAQVAINPGTHPKSSGQSPVDWNYQVGHIGASITDQVGAGLRQFHTIIKKWQLMNSSRGVNGVPNSSEGFSKVGGAWWSPDHSRINYLNSMVQAVTRNEGIYKNLDRQTLRALYEVALEVWDDITSEYEASDFPQGENDSKFRPESYRLGSSDDIRRYIYADQFYYGLPKAYRFLGVDKKLVRPILDWGSKMWPKGDWSGKLASGHAAWGTGNGLTMQIYEGSELSGQPDATLNDKRVSFMWEKGQTPASGIDWPFAVRWKGKIQPFFTEKLKFFVRNTGSLRVFLDGKLIYDQLDRGGGWRLDEIKTPELQKGKTYPIRIEFKARRNDRSSRIHLRWRGMDWFGTEKAQANMLVPKPQLYGVN